MDDGATLNAAFDTFWVDAERSAGAGAYANLRQAFKNGAAFPLARAKVRGEAALDQLATQDEARALQEAWPWITMNMKAHHEWGEVHRDAMLAAFSPRSLCGGSALRWPNEWSRYKREKTMGSSG